MNTERTINVHHSSLVGLQAELLRKQAEVAAAKASQQNVRILNRQTPKEKRSSQREKKLEAKRARESSKKQDDDDPDSMKVLKKSQLMLQAKSRLYSQLSKRHLNMNPNFLVDFASKPDGSDHSEEEKLEEEEEDRQREPEEKEEEDVRRSGGGDDDDDYGSDDEWAEYTDCFGRTRKCLRVDLPKMREEDDRLFRKIAKSPPPQEQPPVLKRERSPREEPSFLEDREPMKEPTIEVMRRKWEEQTAKLADKADIHYQDVLFDEARVHGVGYYAFSQDEAERARQMESLDRLRKETSQRQKENERIREMKERMQQNRLKAARMRQRLRAGLPLEEPEEEKTDDGTTAESEDGQTVQKEDGQVEKNEGKDGEKDDAERIKQEKARQKLEDTENKIQAFGKLLGKRNKWYVMSQEEWVDKKRKDRLEEFAPVYKNYEKGETSDISGSARNTAHRDSTNSNESVGDESDFIGPVPPPQDESSEIGPVPPPQDESCIIGSVPPPQNESSIIGPVPPPQEEISKIGPVPPPEDESSQIGPVPPLLNEEFFIGPIPPPSEDSSQSTEDLTCNTSISLEDQIAAGLKFLRQQFESKHRR